VAMQNQLKIIKIGLLFILVIVNAGYSQRTADILIENAQITDSFFSWEIHITPTNDWGTDNRKAIGDCSWFFSYNSSGLSNPVLTFVSAQVGETAGYTSSVAIIGGYIGVTTDLDTDNFDGSNLETVTTYHIYTIRMDINDPAQHSNLLWNQIDTGIFNARDNPITVNYVGDGDIKLPVESNREVITEYRLFQNNPNPFNPQTDIRFQMPIQAQVTIKIYNMLGKEIRTLIDGKREPGFYTVSWNGDNNIGKKVASGVYLYMIKANHFVQVRKMLLMK